MNLRQVIHSVCTVDEDLAALINGRHFRVKAPQNTERPYLVSQIIADPAVETHGSEDDAEDTLAEGLVQLTAIADDPDEAAAIIDAVRAAFIDPEREKARAVLIAASIKATSPEDRELEPTDNAGPEQVYAHQLDLNFFHNPSS